MSDLQPSFQSSQSPVLSKADARLTRHAAEALNRPATDCALRSGTSPTADAETQVATKVLAVAAQAIVVGAGIASEVDVWWCPPRVCLGGWDCQCPGGGLVPGTDELRTPRAFSADPGEAEQ